MISAALYGACACCFEAQNAISCRIGGYGRSSGSLGLLELAASSRCGACGRRGAPRCAGRGRRASMLQVLQRGPVIAVVGFGGGRVARRPQSLPQGPHRGAAAPLGATAPRRRRRLRRVVRVGVLSVAVQRSRRDRAGPAQGCRSCTGRSSRGLKVGWVGAGEEAPVLVRVGAGGGDRGGQGPALQLGVVDRLAQLADHRSGAGNSCKVSVQ